MDNTTAQNSNLASLFAKLAEVFRSPVVIYYDWTNKEEPYEVHWVSGYKADNSSFWPRLDEPLGVGASLEDALLRAIDSPRAKIAPQNQPESLPTQHAKLGIVHAIDRQ